MLNDNDPEFGVPPPDPPGSQGRAALLLVESLLHGLCENHTLKICDAIAIAERALDVQQDYADAAGRAEIPEWRALALLQSIKTSLEAEERASPNGD
jgi:hypothetical protein